MASTMRCKPCEQVAAAIRAMQPTGEGGGDE